MNQTFLLEFFQYPFRILPLFFRNLFQGIQWIGKRPSLALSLKLLKEIELKPHSKLRLLDFKSLKMIDQKTAYFGRQVLKENKRAEKGLLKSSQLNFFPHEVWQVRIVNSQNIDFNSPVFHSGQKSTHSYEEMREVLAKLIFKARQLGVVIEEIEIAHTHPTLEVMVENGNDSHFIFNGLSDTDKKLGERLAPFLDYPLRIKAITPQVNYSMLF